MGKKKKKAAEAAAAPTEEQKGFMVEADPHKPMRMWQFMPLTDEGPMDSHMAPYAPFCKPYSWCPCQPTIIYWNPLTRQRTYQHRNIIH